MRPGTPLDPYLQLLDTSGNVLAEDDDGGTQKCVQSRSVQLRFTAPAADVTRSGATSYEITANNNDTIDPNDDGDYTLMSGGAGELVVAPPTDTTGSDDVSRVERRSSLLGHRPLSEPGIALDAVERAAEARPSGPRTRRRRTRPRARCQQQRHDRPERRRPAR